jgi:spore germination protein GerM
MRRIISIVTVCLFILVTLSSCSLLQKLGLQKGTEDELRPASSIVMDENEAQSLTGKVPIHLYFANDDNSKLKLEVRYVSLSDAKQTTDHLAEVIVKELISGPTAGNGLKATIPAGTVLRSVTVKSRVATVDLSKEFKTKHAGGKDAEKMTIFSIVNSLTELTDIQKVKFTIAGKSEKELKGNYQFDSPFARSDAVISKETTPKTNDTPKSNDKKSSGTNTTGDDTQETSGDGSGDLEMLE